MYAVKMNYVGFVLLVLCVAFHTCRSLKMSSTRCPCSKTYLCRTHLFDRNKQVVVVADGRSNYMNWHWKNISTVIANNFTDTQLMCQAHDNQANYAFLEKVPVITNTSDPEFLDWLTSVIDKSVTLFADYIALDFLELTGQCHKSDLHIKEVEEVVNAISQKLVLGGSKVMCVMPWKPPCYDGNCDLVNRMTNLCSLIITSPESFFSTCDLSCVARATVPMSSQVLGLNEYLTHNVPVSQLMIGIPWHGYKYRCQKLVMKEGTHDVCQLTTTEKDNKTVCDYTRTKMTLGEIKKKYPTNFDKEQKTSKIYRAPYFNFEVGSGDSGTEYQIWYENFDSLLDKYLLASDLRLRGVVLWSGDDLSDDENLVQSEWNWMMHTLFSTGNVQIEKPLDFAGIAAAIAVGCLILGAVIGFAVACVISRKQLKRRRLRTPFQKDHTDDMDYHDEDDKTL